MTVLDPDYKPTSLRVDADGRLLVAGVGGGGGGGATNLSYTASPTQGVVVSDTGTDATVPLATGTNAGLMAPAQHAQLTALPGQLAAKLDATDASVTNAREWTAATVTQAEAEAGTDTTRKAWTVQRVWQAITKALGGVTVGNTPAAGQVLTATSGTAATWQAPSGGGGSPGGSDTQIQFNDGGAFAGASGWTWNKTTSTMTLSSGAQTTSNPVEVVTQTWNAGGVTFTGWRLNVTDTASAAASLLADWQVGGASRVSISKAGAVSLAASGTKSAPTINFAASAGSGTCGIWTPNAFSVAFGVQGEPAFVIQFSGVRVGSAASIGWSSSQFGADITGADTTLFRDAANVVAQRNGTNAQEHRTYGTFTDASNYRRLSKGMSTSGVAFLRPEGAGTGASGNVLHISGLPTSNPGPGILWNDAGTVKVGT